MLRLLRTPFLICLLLISQSALSQSLTDSLIQSPVIPLSLTHWEVADSNFNGGLLTDPWDLLRGQVPGLLISRTGHDLNQAPAVRLRGIGSLLSSHTPLVVVDGVPGLPLQSVDPHDIAKLTFLSGGEALAHYGIQGGGGVLLVETYAPTKAQPLQLRYQGQFSYDAIQGRHPVLGPAAYLASVGGQDFGAETDWQEEISQAGYQQAHSLSASGKLAQGPAYRASVHFRQGQGLLRDQGMEQLSGRLHLRQSLLDDRLQLRLDASFLQRQAEIGQPAIIRYALNFNPTAPIFSDDPAFAAIGGYFNQGLFGMYNPVWLVEQGLHEAQARHAWGRFQLRYQWRPGLESELNLSRQQLSSDQGQLSPFDWVEPRANVRLQQDRYAHNWLEWANRYRYQGENMGWGASLILQYQQSAQAFDRTLGNLDLAANQPADLDELIANEANLEPNVQLTEGESPWALPTGIAAVDWHWQQKVFLAAHLRYDRYAGQGQWFPGVSAAWQPVAFAKLKASYGQASHFMLMEPGRTELPFFSPFRLGTQLPRDLLEANPEILASQPERLHSWDIGLDLMGNGWSAQVNVYRRDTRQPWADLSFPFMPGTPSEQNSLPAANLRIRNQGIELRLGWEQSGKRLAYRGQLIAATFQTQLLAQEASGEAFSLADDWVLRPIASSPGSPGFGNTLLLRLAEGEALGQLYGPRLNEAGTRQQGELVLQDLNGPQLGSGETELGNALPNWSVGLMQAVSWGRWSLSALLRGELGHDLVNLPRLHNEPLNLNLPYNRLETGRFDPLPGFPQWHDFYVENAAFLTLDYLQLRYEVPLGRSVPLAVSLTARNLFTLTNYSGLDPAPRLLDPGPGADELGGTGFQAPFYFQPGLDRRSGMYAARSLVVGIEWGW